MITPIDLPPRLLKAVDRASQELGMSRDRYIIRALERALETETRWSTRFAYELKTAGSDDEARQDMADLVTVVTANRTRKAPPEF